LKLYLATLSAFMCLGLAYGQNPSGTHLSHEGPMRVYSQIEPMQPAPQAPNSYPLGNDLVMRTSGSADIHITTKPVLVSSNSAAGPGPATIAVPSTAQLCPGDAGCSLVIDPDTPQEEAIAPDKWCIDSPTQITATFALSHAPGFVIEQVGAVGFDTRAVSLNAGASSDHPLKFTDRNNNPVITVTNDTGGTWPNSAIQFEGLLTGNNGRTKDLLVRYNTPQSYLRFLNSQNSQQLMTMDNAGVTNFYGSDMYVHGTLHVSSVIADKVSASTLNGQEQVVESPDQLTVLSGVAILNDAGEATVSVPTSFEASNQNFRYQLTTIGSFAPVYIAEELQDNAFRIAGGKRRMHVSWQITGVRDK
jgi:hypothetical protein